MSTLQALLQRKETVQSTQKMMSAMKVVAATKLRQLAKGLQDLKGHLSALEKLASHLSIAYEELVPVSADKKKPPLWVVLGANRGLCGHFHTQILREIKVKAAALSANPTLYVFGTKTAAGLKRLGFHVQECVSIPRMLSPMDVSAYVAGFLGQREKFGSITVISTHFKNALIQEVQALDLKDLLKPLVTQELKDWKVKSLRVDIEAPVLMEPSRTLVVRHIAQMYLVFCFAHLFLQSTLSEEGCRMTAMDGATRNSSDLIEQIDLLYNRTRQAAITKELIEVISGAQAL